MAETYFEGTRWLHQKIKEFEFEYIDNDKVVRYRVPNPEYVEWLEERVAAFENDETPTRRELALRKRQLVGLEERITRLNVMVETCHRNIEETAKEYTAKLVELGGWFELHTGHERPSWAPKKEQL